MATCIASDCVGCLRLQVVRQSRLYESAPAYVTDQPVFLNAALAVRTALPPQQLLAALKHVEVWRSQPQHVMTGIPVLHVRE